MRPAELGELTATGRRRGKLIGTGEARAIIGVSGSTMLALLGKEYGPPGFKRPGGGHWLFFEGEVLDWLESNRRKTNGSSYCFAHHELTHAALKSSQVLRQETIARKLSRLAIVAALKRE